MKFKDFLVIMEYLNAGSAAMLPSNWSGSEQTPNMMTQPVFLPSMDLALPSVTKVGKIAMLIKDRNPIMLQMSDGSKLFFTHDQFKRVKGSPGRGKMMTVVFQRNPTDRSNMPSRIQSCHIN